jgi:hypothetical protein
MLAALDDRLAAFAVHPRRLALGAGAMLVMSLAYNIVAINLAIIGGVPVPPPFLAIPADGYFFWAALFYTPALMAGWVFAGACVQLAARALGGNGSFEDTLAVLGVATAIATLPALLPDLAITFVQLAGAMDYAAWRASVDGFGVWFWIVWAYLVVYIAAFAVLYPAAVRAAHHLAGPAAWVAGLAGFALYQGFILLFIR